MKRNLAAPRENDAIARRCSESTKGLLQRNFGSDRSQAFLPFGSASRLAGKRKSIVVPSNPRPDKVTPLPPLREHTFHRHASSWSWVSNEPQLPFQFRRVSLHPAPHLHVIGFQTALE
jgi:hypothetical protein